MVRRIGDLPNENYTGIGCGLWQASVGVVTSHVNCLTFKTDPATLA